MGFSNQSEDLNTGERKIVFHWRRHRRCLDVYIKKKKLKQCDEFLRKHLKDIKNTEETNNLKQNCLDMVKIPIETKTNLLQNNISMKEALIYSSKEICEWLYQNEFNIENQKISFDNNIFNGSLLNPFNCFRIMEFLPFESQRKNLKLYHTINIPSNYNTMDNNEKYYLKDMKLFIQKNPSLICKKGTVESLIISSLIKLHEDNNQKLMKFYIFWNNSFRNNNDLKMEDFHRFEKTNNLHKMLKYDEYTENSWNNSSIILFDNDMELNLLNESKFLTSSFHQKETYNSEDLLEAFRIPEYFEFGLSDSSIDKKSIFYVINDYDEEFSFYISLISKTDQFQNSNFYKTAFHKSKNVKKKSSFLYKKKYLSYYFNIYWKFFRFFHKKITSMGFSNSKDYQNCKCNVLNKETKSNKSLNNINTSKKLNLILSNIFNTLTENCKSLWIPKIITLKNREFTLKLTKIVQITRDRQTFIIVDLTKYINAIDIRKQLCKKLGIVESWSKCRIFIIEIYNNEYEEELNDEKLVLARFYADSLGSLKFFIELSSKEIDKRNNNDIIPVYSTPNNDFFKIFSNILSKKTDLEFNKIQLNNPISKWSDNDIILIEDLNYRLGNQDFHEKLKDENKKTNLFSVSKNDQDNFFIKKNQNNINIKSGPLLNKVFNLSEYSKFLNNIHYHINDRKKINIKEIQLKLGKSCISKNFLFILEETFPLNLKRKLIEKLFNTENKSNYRKKDDLILANGNELKRIACDFKNSFFFSTELNNQHSYSYDKNIYGFLFNKEIIQKLLNIKFSITENISIADIDSYDKNIFRTYGSSENSCSKENIISFNNELGSKELFPDFFNLKLNIPRSFFEDKMISNIKTFSDINRESAFKEFIDLSDDNSVSIGGIENEQEMFWAVKPKKIADKITSNELNNSDTNYSSNYKSERNTPLNTLDIINILDTHKKRIVFNKFSKPSLESENIENNLHNSILYKSSVTLSKDIFEEKNLCYNDKWEIRPSTQVVYDNLEDFFPNHDLDKPIINQLADFIDFLGIDNISDIFLVFLRTIFSDYNFNIENCMKSIKIVAKEASESQKKYENNITNKNPIPRKKSTKLWGVKLQEMKLNKDKDDYNFKKTCSIKRTPTFKWIKGKLIGKGRYGEVYLAMNATTGEMLAVKQVKLYHNLDNQDNEYQKELINALNKEIETMKDLDHPNIVQYLGFESTKTTISIFLEYVSGGSIGRCIRKYGKIDQQTIQLFTRQILEGLTYLHSQGILHRDLKTDNILLDVDGICKISDFGISKKSKEVYDNDSNMSMQGTIFWMAPEVIHNQKQGYSAKIDIWSLGCLVLEMFAGKRPWSDDEAIGVMFKVGNEHLAPPIPHDIQQNIKSDALDFLKLCFIVDPSLRPTARQLLSHPFIKNADSNFKFSDSSLSQIIKLN
ncbi:hypothetical protein PNEG_02958 [Pneumocystis murina B123]|uniref:mitogen-activated protein kinase kinase kinase n=1 Tax=Pneumocystis murina (strain B123) TaxID=1069680 RepID=M7NJL4_PNEMU|nr:hypothetical protein PNEG_02958 [Pneumocystis murina B123]EMR08788.1 hypothetical protein PNEG_02958 [Pneumocystis murina B123]